MADIKMPQLGESVTEGTIGKWLKAVGDPVSKYEPIAEVITDKVTAEVPSDFDGVLQEIVVPEGETVQVGTVICTVETEGDPVVDTAPKQQAHESSKDAPVDPHLVKRADEGSSGAVASASVRAQDAPSRPEAEGARFSPAVLRLAQEHDIDLSSVHGTGEGGRITRKDVLAFVADGKAHQERLESAGDIAHTSEKAEENVMISSRESTTSPIPSPQDGADEEWITPSPIRKTIAKRMLESKHNAPHAWTMVEADVSSLVDFRNRVKGDFKRREGIDLTYLPFFIKAVVEAIKRYPVMNASWVDDKIVMHKRIHTSIAVATDDVLVVPVIHDADRLSVAGLAHRVNELAAKARSGRLSMDDVQGGTFTVNNTGAFGSILSQPILNAPQAGILSVESIVKRPVVVTGDAIAVRSMVNLCLSLDHRVLDGWVAGQFLRAVRERLESFDAETVLY